jgi:hypothetical protein
MKRFLTSLALATIVTASAQAAAQDMPTECLGHGDLRSYLDRAFAETRVAVAEAENGNRVELFASRRGSWTLVELKPDGQSCIQAHGKRMRVERSNVTKRPAS